MTVKLNPVLMFRKDEATNTVTSAVVDPDEIAAYQGLGWTLEDPAFLPDDYSDVANQRGLVRVVSNFGGTSKFVSPHDVAWYEQNGWRAAHRIADEVNRFTPEPLAPKAARPVPTTTGSQRVVPSESTDR